MCTLERALHREPSIEQLREEIDRCMLNPNDIVGKDMMGCDIDCDEIEKEVYEILFNHYV